MTKLEPGKLGEVLQQSLSTVEGSSSDCVDFNFDIKVVSIKGSFCKSGEIEFTVSVAGVEIGHQKLNIHDKEYCNKVGVGVEEVKYCFYIKHSCLYTKGYVDGWFHDKHSWDEKIVCL